MTRRQENVRKQNRQENRRNEYILYVLISECGCKAASIHPPLQRNRETERRREKEREEKIARTARGCRTARREAGIETVLRSLRSYTERMVGGLVAARRARGGKGNKGREGRGRVERGERGDGGGGHVDGGLRGERSLRRRYYYSQLEDYQYP